MGVGRLRSDSLAGEGRERRSCETPLSPTRAAPHTQPLSELIRAANSCQCNHTAGATGALHLDRCGGLTKPKDILEMLFPGVFFFCITHKEKTEVCLTDVALHRSTCRVSSS